LGELKASYRQVQPLRLEKRGSLYYLHAYCYRAETNLTFRMDRIQHLQL
jgi:predicted DNA-binding transcriptional regulator YafY